ncbi:MULTISPECIES: ATP-binding protein [unclassified Pseudoalteromonas]|uniref:ATP-binding protein n=1 Tax=unclassified Pseudoalteromonas TaxID=194690 RepID=UPI002358E779|nr:MULTISPECIES: ATP-binding protein [unclassified Pseudoalteromonas]MDC9566170.1 sensor histidine kinase [Pseudoalteromonas sp. GAB2316C]MDC9568409.1 sensor histidine kinase [Pseudoalteromonas sp. GABNB9D]MDC9572799.1 sensor histidine kinase [Pseudoalteromonas sp. GABNS16A]MDC9576900.1 sensor histidine kinase [Pseudoalteromonas sp. GABNS16E]MDC9584444.1 sensor histidine kinase [Pseudoalteromonas sp. GABNS16C]
MFIQTDPTISRLLMLRSGAIAVQLIAVLSVYFLLEHQIALLPLLVVIAIEAIFQLVSVFAYRNVSQARPIGMLMQLTADVLFLTILLSLSGGATNAFVSLLLLPIMIAAVTLREKGLAYIAVLAIAAYSFLLIRMPDHSMHQMNMSGHFIGMWVNFVLSASVIALVIGAMSRALKERERTIAKAREQQLRNEQLVTLDGAAAQITHQLASPIANLQLLFEELLEDQPNNPVVVQMQTPLKQCARQLNDFRKLSAQLRNKNTTEHITVNQLQTQIIDTLLLQHPDQHINWLSEPIAATLKSDAMLLPAILNLLQNACIANQKNNQTQLELSWQQDNQHSECIYLLIRDFGSGFSQSQLTELGGQLMPSSQGMGLAVLLSNVTFERLNGSLTLYNHAGGGAVAKVKLAIANNEQPLT